MANQQSALSVLDAGSNQPSVGLQVQTYCISILNQPLVDFTGFPQLSSTGTSINNNLNATKDVSLNYLAVIQSDIIKNINNIISYYTLNSVIASVVPSGITREQWLNSLARMQELTSEYSRQAGNVATNISSFSNIIATNTRELNTDLNTLNAELKGDNGLLATLQSELDGIQKKIDATIAGVASSALSIIAGAFLIAIGAVASLITAGTSVPLIAGGVGLIALGTGGEAASAKILQDLNQTKAAIISQQNMLKTETKLVTGIASAMSSLSQLSSRAIQSASQMKNAWDFQRSDLSDLSNQLSKGIISTDYLQQLYLSAADNTVPSVLASARIISLQMSGVSSVLLDSCMSMGSCISGADK